jgi:uncharacterized protein with ParB-like and HNH nuclease domain
VQRVQYESEIIQDILALSERKELNLNPWYQRRSVWTNPQKSYLINSVFEQKPVPSVYIRHSLDLDREKSIKEVVDGQQRIRAIIDYVNGGFAARHPDHPKPVKYAALTRSQREEFRLTSLSVGYLMGASDTDVIEIFGRLNSVSKTLNQQEKRNALFSGEFKQFALTEAASRVKLWRDLTVFTANDIARMLEVQFVSELAINMLNGLQDYSERGITKVYEEFDETFHHRASLESRMERIWAKLVTLKPDAIKDTIFSRSPLFFSLFIILDSIKARITKTILEDALWEIDERFSSGVPLTARPKKEAAFVVACTSNLHRIPSRRIRDSYIRSFVAQ